jgi:hypothetical protein
VLTHGVLFRDKIRKALAHYREAGREMKQQFYFTPVCSLEKDVFITSKKNINFTNCFLTGI